MKNVSMYMHNVVRSNRWKYLFGPNGISVIKVDDIVSHDLYDIVFDMIYERVELPVSQIIEYKIKYC